MRRIAGGLALALLSAAPAALVVALLAHVLFGMWWLGLVVLSVWVAATIALGSLARRKRWDTQGTLGALSKAFGANSGGWPKKRP